MVLTDFMFKILVRNPNSQQTLFVIVSEELLMIYTIKKERHRQDFKKAGLCAQIQNVQWALFFRFFLIKKCAFHASLAED